jgi:hypothetical protein
MYVQLIAATLYVVSAQKSSHSETQGDAEKEDEPISERGAA